MRIALIRMQMAQRRGQIYEFMCKCSKKFGTRTLEKSQSRAVCVADSKFLCYFRRRANELLRRAAAAATTAHSHSLPTVSCLLPQLDMHYRAQPQSMQWKIAFLIIALVGDVSCIRNSDAAHDE